MVRNVLIALLWFPITIALLTLNLILLASLQQKTHRANAGPVPVLKITASSHGTEQVLSASIEAGDARSFLLTRFLDKHDSPLTDYSQYILNRADHYAIDFRLVPAIAMCESGVGKHIPSRDSYNAWGVAVMTGTQSGAKFPNWLYAIDWVSRYIKEKYMDKGMTTPLLMGPVWAPPSVSNGNSWANCVEFFMDEIE